MWVIFALLDPDPGTPLNPDPDPQHRKWLSLALLSIKVKLKIQKVYLRCIRTNFGWHFFGRMIDFRTFFQNKSACIKPILKTIISKREEKKNRLKAQEILPFLNCWVCSGLSGWSFSRYPVIASAINIKFVQTKTKV